MDEEEIKKRIENPIPIKKKIKILHDGKQFMVKIPKEISDFFNIKKGDFMILTIQIPEDKNKNFTTTFEIERG